MLNSIAQSWGRLAESLQFEHDSMSERDNPVLVLLQRGGLTAKELGNILAQYSLLPATIVEFLATGASQLKIWPDVRGELERNMREELGSRTDGQSHYEILKAALLSELGLDVTETCATNCTSEFLSLIRKGLLEESPDFIAGGVYALEASAIPELTIVACLINEYARLTELPNEPIDLFPLQSLKRDINRYVGVNDKYSLNSFFASHLLDFEVGHRNGLAAAVQKYVGPEDIEGFEAGFEYVLDAMDRWWQALAQRDSEAELFNTYVHVEDDLALRG